MLTLTIMEVENGKKLYRYTFMTPQNLTAHSNTSRIVLV